ncbi:MAG: SPFH domain-containing protein [Anaerolineae bacterium]|jgi:membrane protease subunit (stomatin/prohibitin family)
MLNKVRGVLQVIEYLDPTGQEIVHRVPEEGSGEIILGSQCVVRENQVAIFFRDGRALDMLGPGRHTLTTLNIPVLVNYLKIPFGSKSPFRAEVVFVNVKDYVDMSWQTPRSIAFRDEDLGVVRLGTRGKFAFQVGRPQLFVNQIVGTQGLYRSENIVGYLQDILVSKFADLLGEIEASLLDLPAKYDELSGGLRARASDDFEAMGLLLKCVYVTSINVPEEVERALDERAQIGALGDMQAYMQFKAARALGDAAQTGGGGEGSLAGLGVGLGAGVGLGTAMASAISQSIQGTMGASPSARVAAPGESGGIEQGFANLRNLVAQQLTLSPEEKEGAQAALDRLFAQLASSTSTMEDLKTARQDLTDKFPWLAEPVRTLLNTPAALQMLGQIAARSM